MPRDPEEDRKAGEWMLEQIERSRLRQSELTSFMAKAISDGAAQRAAEQNPKENER